MAVGRSHTEAPSPPSSAHLTVDLALQLVAFSGLMALAQFSPGPDMILLTRTALAEGARAGILMAAGIASGLAVHATIAVAGMAVVIERNPAWRKAIAWAAAGYLLWLAFRMVRGRLGSESSTDRPSAAARPPFLRGLLCNLLNPKAALFLAAMTAPFLREPRPGWWPLSLWAVAVFQGGILWALWARLLQVRPIRLGYQKSALWIDFAFAGALVAMSLKLLIGG